ncbi:RagB/SusD family nutrient uptake outer membrane protein [Mucilaginibacter gracilis]|nr:RagB/SusD family nutrient uptake outer membrane protein [Mucilaginibacter gracilis]
MGILVAGCNKFVDVPAPVDSITGARAFDTDAKADAAVRGMYLYMVLGNTSGYGSTSPGLGVCSDELSLTTNTTSNAYYQLYNNAITSVNSSIYNYYWAPMYNVIYTANAIIEGCANSTGMSAAAKIQYTAEAKFLRAVNYFYLVNLWGDVPMPVSSDYTVNENLSRTPASQVYSLIVADLQYAQANLAKTYLGGALRYRANRYAASAMLARVYLYQQDWADAETAATDVIDGAGSSVYAMEPTLNNAFLVTSKEVILQIVQPATNLYTWDAFNFVPSLATSLPNYPITDALYYSFETGDLRKTNWIKTITIGTVTAHAPYKYKLTSGTTATASRTEALVFLRLGEQYLIRAEARAQQNKLATAITDLDAVRHRAGITLIGTTQPNIIQADLLTKIAHERFVELFAEQGHRWLDLKRTGQADVVLAGKPNWTPQAQLFPIPATDITNDHNLVQNPGYN